MKRLVWFFVLINAAATAQTVNIYHTSMMPGSDWDMPDDNKPVLMVWHTNDKCYECATRYLMNCGDSNPDCNVPGKGVLHYGWFKSKKDALAMADKQQIDLVGLYDTAKSAVEKTETDKHDPQPDRVTKIVHYATR